MSSCVSKARTTSATRIRCFTVPGVTVNVTNQGISFRHVRNWQHLLTGNKKVNKRGQKDHEGGIVAAVGVTKV